MDKQSTIIRSKTTLGSSAVKARPVSSKKIRTSSKRRNSINAAQIMTQGGTMPTVATTAASQNPAASFKDPRLANVAKILEKKRTMDSDHKPVMGLGMSGSQLSLKSGGTAASNAPNTGEKIAIDKLKRAVM